MDIKAYERAREQMLYTFNKEYTNILKSQEDYEEAKKALQVFAPQEMYDYEYERLVKLGDNPMIADHTANAIVLNIHGKANIKRKV